MDSQRISADELLVHAAGLRRLAVRLVGDGADADDLVQQALVAGLEHPPTRTQPLAAWFDRVMKNFARQRWRGDSNRARREMFVARAESEPSEAEMIERLELHRVVVEEVLALPDPYRRAILSLYFDNVRADEHAKSLGVAPGTVRSQVSRGIEMLRDRLDERSNGDRSAWMTGLIAFARTEPQAATGAWLASGGWLVAKTLVVLVLASGLFAVVWRAACVAPQPLNTAIAKSNGVQPKSSGPQPTVAALSVPEQGPESVRSSVTSPPSIAVHATISESFGRVIDAVTRAPIAHAKVEVFFDDTPFAPSELGASASHPIVVETNAEGRFRAAVPALGEIAFRISARGYTHAYIRGDMNHATADTANEFRLYVTPRVRITVRRDATLSAPLRAALRLKRDDLLFASDRALVEPDDINDDERVGERDADGRFVFDDLPIGDTFGFECVAGSGKSLLKAEFVTLQAGEIKDFEADETTKRFVTIVGTLLDTTNAPIANHEVWLMTGASERIRAFCWADESEARITRSTSQGEFVFEHVVTGSRVLVGPGAPKANQGEIEGPNGELIGVQLDPSPAILALGDRAVAPVAEAVMIPLESTGKIPVTVHAPRGNFIRGHVVDPNGAPVSRVEVSVSWEGMRSDYQETYTDDEGRFVFGPCGAEQLTLTADDGTFGRFARSDETTVHLGDGEATVRLKRAGRILGRVVDGTTRELMNAARVQINTRDEDAEHRGWQILSAEEGTFRLDGLTFGTFDIVARAKEGQIGVRHITLNADHDVASIDIPVSPAAKLHAQCAPDHFFSVLQGDALVFTSLNAASNPLELTVPSGDLLVEFIAADSKVIESVPITLAPGEVRQVAQTKK